MSGRIVIVEGPDGLGKTSLVRMVSEATGALKTVPLASVEPQARGTLVLADGFKSLHDYEGHKVVYDRHPFVSEPVYGPYPYPQVMVHNLLDTARRFVPSILVAFVLPELEYLDMGPDEAFKLFGVDDPEVGADRWYQVWTRYEQVVESLVSEVGTVVIRRKHDCWIAPTNPMVQYLVEFLGGGE